MQFLDRTTKLLGQENIDKLKNAKVIIFGVGGVGGYAFETLIRSGVENIDIVDFDVVDETNINRQIIALYSTIGKKKTNLCKNRALDINLQANINIFDIKYEPNVSNEIEWSNYNYIIDAIDDVIAKVDIIKKAKTFEIPIISSMGTGNKFDLTKLTIDDISTTHTCPLARKMRKILKKEGIEQGVKVVYSTEIVNNRLTPPGTVMYVPATAGMLIASEVIKDIIHI